MIRHYTIIQDGEEHKIEIKREENHFELSMDGVKHRFVPILEQSPLYSFLIDDSKVFEADISFQKDACQLNYRNVPYQLEVFDPRRRSVSQSEASGGDGVVRAPMPGKVVEVLAKSGEQVTKGQAVVVIEAMKMQNELASEIDGSVAEIFVKAGDTVEAGTKLVAIAKA